MADIDKKSWNLLFIAWLVALAATFGALFMSEIMGRAPCILCWYQRIFMFPLSIILGIGLFKGDDNIKYYALPLSLGGLAVAVFHSLLYFKILPEAVITCDVNGPSCTNMDMTIWGGLPIPLLSTVAFIVTTFLLLMIWRKRS